MPEEWPVRRPLGWRAAPWGALEHLLEVARVRNVELHVMSMDRERRAGPAGGIKVLTFADGSTEGARRWWPWPPGPRAQAPPHP
ncbi:MULTISPECIES: Scr1 family TA system antitoxin-like transcriptional regulator [unclassified Streptomyces]|uniref:Scr1 family TA system antitoxin-like transcriptional regulator n=1 Tax=unclassified Streptomyces TaxID=2593676 RepID=UPI002475E44E|nr:Scr1 family TA system antitoxin-like transcriptional regulator [Streptomyces sp. SAI-133]